MVNNIYWLVVSFKMGDFPEQNDSLPEGNPYLCVYMAMSQNCVWNVPRCSGRMERRGFVTGLVPDLWNVMKYKLYININMYTVYYM